MLTLYPAAESRYSASTRESFGLPVAAKARSCTPYVTLAYARLHRNPRSAQQDLLQPYRALSQRLELHVSFVFCMSRPQTRPCMAILRCSPNGIGLCVRGNGKPSEIDEEPPIPPCISAHAYFYLLLISIADSAPLIAARAQRHAASNRMSEEGAPTTFLTVQSRCDTSTSLHTFRPHSSRDTRSLPSCTCCLPCSYHIVVAKGRL